MVTNLISLPTNSTLTGFNFYPNIIQVLTKCCSFIHLNIAGKYLPCVYTHKGNKEYSVNLKSVYVLCSCYWHFPFIKLSWYTASYYTEILFYKVFMSTNLSYQQQHNLDHQTSYIQTAGSEIHPTLLVTVYVESQVISLQQLI